MVFGAESLIRHHHLELSDDVFYYDVTRKCWDTVSMTPGTLSAKAYTAVSLQYEVYLTGVPTIYYRLWCLQVDGHRILRVEIQSSSFRVSIESTLSAVCI